MAAPLVTINDRGTIRGVEVALLAIPQAAEKARRRALGKLKTFVESQVAKVVAAELKVTQKAVKALGRVRESVRGDGALSIWIGTNDIPVHRLGTVTWTRGQKKGAKVGRKYYPGTWSWGPGSRTGTAVMRRQGASRLPIESVREPMHDAVSQRVRALLPAVSERYGKLMRQEMKFALRELGR
jgi:hypothetical protein